MNILNHPNGKKKKKERKRSTSQVVTKENM